MKAFLQTYGYWAILVSIFLESETILVLAGIIAHRGYLDLKGVILATFIGSVCGAQRFFYLGRRHSKILLHRQPVRESKLRKAEQRSIVSKPH